MLIELSANAGDKRRRHEDRSQHQCNGDESRADLFHRPVGRVTRAHPQSNISLDVLDDDNRVVDNDANRQHESKEREIVEREAEQAHEEECADQRNRDRNDRNDCRAPRLQEYHNDENDQGHRFENGAHDGIDRLLNEVGRIINDRVLQARRKAFRQFLHCRLDGGGGGDGVGTGQLKNAQADSWIFIKIRIDAVVESGELDACDVL